MNDNSFEFTSDPRFLTKMYLFVSGDQAENHEIWVAQAIDAVTSFGGLVRALMVILLIVYIIQYPCRQLHLARAF